MSQEQQQFTSEPLGEKGVETVPGIAEQFVERLNAKGYKYAYQLMGKYLALGKEEAVFKSWLRYRCGEGFGKNKQDQVFQCMREIADRLVQ